MCDDQRRSTRERLLPRPRWATLYGIAILGTSSAVAVEAFSPAGAARIALRCGVAIGGFVGMALWIRLNRVALDAEERCACAGETMTVRVISVPAAEPHRPAHAGAQRVAAPHELAAR